MASLQFVPATFPAVFVDIVHEPFSSHVLPQEDGGSCLRTHYSTQNFYRTKLSERSISIMSPKAMSSNKGNESKDAASCRLTSRLRVDSIRDK